MSGMLHEVFRFDAGRISLDLMATLGLRCGELLPDPAALEGWLVAAGLADGDSTATDEDLRLARMLRSALFDLVAVALHGGDLSARDVAVVNAAASASASVPAPVLSAVAGRFEHQRPGASVAQALGIVARDAIELLTGPERALIRECAAEQCSGIYLDTSRGARRRWCSSALCGNRERVAAHRARRTAGVEGDA